MSTWVGVGRGVESASPREPWRGRSGSARKEESRLLATGIRDTRGEPEEILEVI